MADIEFNENEIGKNINSAIIEMISLLILEVEDLIQLINNIYGIWGTTAVSRNKNTNMEDIKNKTAKIREQYKGLILKLGNKNIIAMNEDSINYFTNMGDFYIDDILSEWMIKADQSKAIDDAHNLCYKLRELIRNLTT
jgi:hypothetical protein